MEPGEIFVVDIDGSNLVNVSNSPLWEDSDPAWSFDSSKLLLSSQRGGRLNIYIVNRDGTSLEKLTDVPSGADIEYSYPSWQP